VYVLDGVGAHADLLERLGPHTTGEACIYLKDVDKVDLAVLEEIVARSHASLTSDTLTDADPDNR
jgi:predicted GIY-YIG superfamily endonuclease